MCWCGTRFMGDREVRHSRGRGQQALGLHVNWSLHPRREREISAMVIDHLAVSFRLGRPGQDNMLQKHFTTARSFPTPPTSVCLVRRIASVCFAGPISIRHVSVSVCV